MEIINQTNINQPHNHPIVYDFDNDLGLNPSNEMIEMDWLEFLTSGSEQSYEEELMAELDALDDMIVVTNKTEVEVETFDIDLPETEHDMWIYRHVTHNPVDECDKVA